jgi:hypothetical protein
MSVTGVEISVADPDPGLNVFRIPDPTHFVVKFAYIICRILGMLFFWNKTWNRKQQDKGLSIFATTLFYILRRIRDPRWTNSRIRIRDKNIPDPQHCRRCRCFLLAEPVIFVDNKKTGIWWLYCAVLQKIASGYKFWWGTGSGTWYPIPVQHNFS